MAREFGPTLARDFKSIELTPRAPAIAVMSMDEIKAGVASNDANLQFAAVQVRTTRNLPQSISLRRSPFPINILWRISCQMSTYPSPQSARKILSRERNPPIEALIATGTIPRFVEFLGRADSPKLQFEVR